MDPQSGNGLDVWKLIGAVTDAFQKHSAKNVLSSPEYQEHYQKLMGTGEMSPQLQKWATNPYIGKALDEGIHSRVSMMGPTEMDNLGGYTPQGSAARQGQLDAGALGGVSPEARKVQLEEQTIGNSKQHYNDAAINTFLDNFLKNSMAMSPEDMQNKTSDYLKAARDSGSPTLSGIAQSMLSAAEQRKSDKMKLTEGLHYPGKEGKGFTIGGVSPFGDTPPGPGETVNNFRKDEVINAYKKLSGLNNPPVQGSGATVSGPVQDLSGLPYTPPAPVTKPQAPSFSFQPTGSNVNSPSAFMQPSSPVLRDAGDVQNVMKQTQARLKAYIEAQNKIPRSSTSGIQQANQIAQQINSLAQPFTTLYNKMSEMGVQPTEEMHQLMQQLIKSGYSATQKSVEGAAPLPPKK